MAGGTGNPKFLRRTAEDLRTVKQHVAISDKRQVGFVFTGFLELKNKARQLALIGDV